VSRLSLTELSLTKQSVTKQCVTKLRLIELPLPELLCIDVLMCLSDCNLSHMLISHGLANAVSEMASCRRIVINRGGQFYPESQG
jgi:hypothetical protein